MAKTPYYTKAESDSKRQEAYREIKQTTEAISVGEGGKLYDTLSLAQAVDPKPVDGTIFTVSEKTDPTNAGCYSFQSSETGGTRFERKIVRIEDIRDHFLIYSIQPTEKSRILNETVREIGLTGDMLGRFLVIRAVQYTDSNTKIAVFIGSAETTDGVVSKQLRGTAEINPDGDTYVELTYKESGSDMNISGYAILDVSKYYPSNTGAALLTDDATYNDRGINRKEVKDAIKADIIPKTINYNGVFGEGNFQLNQYFAWRLKSGVKLYIKGEINDYLSLSYLQWGEDTTLGTKKIVLQIRKTDTKDQLLSDGTIVYSFSYEFPADEMPTGIKRFEISAINNYNKSAVLEFNFNYLPFEIGSTSNQYINNTTGSTYNTNGLDINKLNIASEDFFGRSSEGGFASYPSLYDAYISSAKGLFSVGGTMLTNTIETPQSKKDYRTTQDTKIPVLNRKTLPPLELYYYNQLPIKLLYIDDEDNFYFAGDNVIIKAPHIKEATYTDISSSDFSSGVEELDVESEGNYKRLSTYEVLFTNADLSVDKIDNLTLSFDNELVLNVIKNGLERVMITENNQTSIRQMTFNGVTADHFEFGDGVRFNVNWGFTHFEDLMFISDYDSGIDTGNYSYKERGTTGGQKCYKSTDNGYTFTEVFAFDGDWSNVLNAENITDFHKPQAHIHGVHYDVYSKRLWIITGDGAVHYDNSSLFWSDDLGQTWTHQRSTVADTGGRTQLVNAVSFNNCILFGTDASNVNGVTRVSTVVDSGITQEIAFDDRENETGLFAYARNVFRRENSPTFISFGKNAAAYSSDVTVKSFVLATFDGWNIFKIYEEDSGLAYGNMYALSDTSGNIYVSMDGEASIKNKVQFIKKIKWIG